MDQIGLEDIYSAKKYLRDFFPAVKKYSESLGGITLREVDIEIWGEGRAW